MSNGQKWDVVVIGGGPGGYSAAIRCGQLGLKTLLIEKERLGGTCLNVGCIPTKSYVHFAEMVSNIKNAPKIGINVKLDDINLETFLKHKETTVKRLTTGVSYLLQHAGVTVETGIASFLSPKRIMIKTLLEEKIVNTEKVIIAVGTSPRELDILPFDHEKVVTSTDVLSWTSLPGSLAIVGGGVIGMEFASIFSQLGVRVTVIEQLPEILCMEDQESVEVLTNALKKRGVRIHTSTSIRSVKKTQYGVELALEDHRQTFQLETEKILVAAGRQTNIHQLGLENTEVHYQNGYIVTDERMETNVEGIFAVGDVTPTWPLAHVAYEEGMIAAENVAGNHKVISYHAVPRCIYTNPEISAVGLTEQQAKEKYGSVKTISLPLSSNGKAMINGNGIGVGKMKLTFETKYGEILGFSLAGEGVNELIAEGALAMHLEATIEELAEVIHPHPSLTEGIKELALLAAGSPLHAVQTIREKDKIHTS